MKVSAFTFIKNGQLLGYPFIQSIKSILTIVDESIINVLEMLDSSSIKCLSGKKIKCEIDSICIHGDGKNSYLMAKKIKNTLKEKKYKLINLNDMNKFK